jgi:hypothetical protein
MQNVSAAAVADEPLSNSTRYNLSGVLSFHIFGSSAVRSSKSQWHILCSSSSAFRLPSLSTYNSNLIFLIVVVELQSWIKKNVSLKPPIPPLPMANPTCYTSNNMSQGPITQFQGACLLKGSPRTPKMAPSSTTRSSYSRILICGGAASDTFAENRSRNSWAYSL